MVVRVGWIVDGFGVVGVHWGLVEFHLIGGREIDSCGLVVCVWIGRQINYLYLYIT